MARKVRKSRAVALSTKLCECGCGFTTMVSSETNSERGWVKGVARRYVNGHNRRKLPQERFSILGGYPGLYIPDNPSSASKGYIAMHTLNAEKALGKPLPLGAVIHHVDENQLNPSNNNLVICQDKAYHNLLHRRMRAKVACGHANWIKCIYCKQYEDPTKLVLLHNVKQNHTTGHHKNKVCLK